ncbi:MAG: hypothetical protein JNK48_04355 [Bryobacterales bacterium]|nr:hypothetical protein [Bryobacterales bacterium]
MPHGSIKLHITDLSGEALRAVVNLDFDPLPPPAGAGGARMHASVNMGPATDVGIGEIECIGGPGTRYMVTVRSKNYCPYSFFQMIAAGREIAGSDIVDLWVDPSRVKEIKGPKYQDLDARPQRWLDTARMFRLLPEDANLLGKSGARLYNALGPLRQASFLNIARKAAHRGTAGNCARFIRSLILCRQDRFFAMVEPEMQDFLRHSPLFKSAPNTLHEPLPDFQMEESFKSRDAHANLQVTLMRHATSGLMAADIDIDESSGIEHGFEVIRNAMFQDRTNPYLIHQFLIAADPQEKTLDPGYRFVFK